MPGFLPFFIILLTAVLFSSLFTRMRVPWVTSLILGGIIIGPHGLKFFSTDSTIEFLASVGLVFLMFMAGLETQLSDVKGIKGRILLLAFISAALPALVGMSIGIMFDYAMPTIILLGIIFMSSSIALLLPSFQAAGIINSKFGKMIIAATLVIDATSLLLLSIFLQVSTNSINANLLFLYPLVAVVIALLAWILPKIRGNFSEYAEEHDLFEKELRLILLILIGLVVLFELIGLHAIIAGFFAGLILSKSVQSRITKAKLHAVSYGLFIPLFFVVVGSSMDIGIFFETSGVLALVTVIVVGSIGSKFISGWITGRILGFTSGESAFLGASTIPSLSTTLAVAYLGFGQGIIDQKLLASIVALSIITSIAAPTLTNLFSGKIEGQKVLLKGSEELVKEPEA